MARKQNQLPSSVRLVEYASGAEVLSAFRNRSIDLAAVTLDEAISLAEHDASLRVGLVLDHSNGADALVARPDIRQLADLKGRSVGAIYQWSFFHTSVLFGKGKTKCFHTKKISLKDSFFSS